MIPAEFDITGKFAFVTGAGRGIGKGIAQVPAEALERAPHGIQINCIAPGLFPDVVTGGEERVRRSEARAKAEVPLGRTGRLREAGLLALYLASPASDDMTGQTILLDGGLGL